MKQRFSKWLAALAAGCMAVTASAFTDTQGHWAESAIQKWSEEYGVIQGYEDGTFHPDDSITRGAFAGILDRFLQFQAVSPADTFSDTQDTYWEDAILKLHAAGVYLGNEGKALSTSSITRQQAVTMIGRAFQITPEITSPDYSDAAQIADYAAPYVAEFSVRGYLTDAADGAFRPTDPITRAEIVSILSNMIHTLIKEGGAWTGTTQGDLLVSAAEGVTLKNAEINGDLILAPGVVGTVTLVDCTLTGNVRNFSGAEVVFVSADPEPEKPEEPDEIVDEEQSPLQPEDVYTPGVVLEGRTITYSNQEIPLYRDRPLNTFSDSDFLWNGDRLAYVGDEFDTCYGIDISSYQGEIDWKTVAAQDIDFAMVRVGYRGYGTGSLNTDSRYRENIRGAMNAGLETGVYFFAQAITVEEAIEEADYVIALLDGLEINGPVAYDWEMHDSSYRVYGTAPEMATACAVAFCERVKEAGYTPMVYAGTYVSYIKYDQGALADYISWYPEYKGDSSQVLCPTLAYHMDYWQFSSSCAVAGIEGRVDMNLRFTRR